MYLLVLWGRGGEQVRCLLYGSGGKRKLCMVSCHNYLIYGIWDLEEQMVEDASKSSFEMAIQAKSGEGNNFNGKEGSHYAIMLSWNFIVNRTGYSKRFYTIHLFPIFLMFDLFFIYYWDSPGQKCKLKCPKVYEILDYIATVIAALTLSCHANTITQKPHNNAFVATKNP